MDDWDPKYMTREIISNLSMILSFSIDYWIFDHVLVLSVLTYELHLKLAIIFICDT
jgi:hypothetical protein